MRKHLLLVCAGLSLCSCRNNLPTGPSEPLTLLTGIVVYEHADYNGDSGHVTRDIENLEDYNGPCFLSADAYGGSTFSWGDCISSVRVAPGWSATFYRDDGFHGERFEVTHDVPNLQDVSGRCSRGGFNDCVSSIRVFQRP
jgi:hypothetical protein